MSEGKCWWGGWWGGVWHFCGKKGVAQRNGYWYCKKHLMAEASIEIKERQEALWAQVKADANSRCVLARESICKAGDDLAHDAKKDDARAKKK